MKTFVLGDCHGALRALKQVLERSKFDYDNDRLICLGDTADGWTETAECFELLFKIKNLVYVMGNHDFWCKEYLIKGKQPDIWTRQGGQNTIASYLKNPKLMKKHGEFLKKVPYYFIDEKNRVFVHGGVSQTGLPIEETDKMFLSWDRELWDNRHNLKKIKEFKEVYVGHTSIWGFSHFPLHIKNVTFMDTGAGWEGKLSLMNIDEESNFREFWQSDKVSDLYPEVGGRN